MKIVNTFIGFDDVDDDDDDDDDDYVDEHDVDDDDDDDDDDDASPVVIAGPGKTQAFAVYIYMCVCIYKCKHRGKPGESCHSWGIPRDPARELTHRL